MIEKIEKANRIIMTLANLLAMGRSFFKGHDAPTYRATRRGFVPQFNSGKNPFAPKTAAEKKPSVQPAAAAAPVKPVVKPMRVTKWADKLNPFRAPEPVRTFTRAEQPELSLQTIKPVQNDLSESDIERVPAKSQTLQPAPVKSTASAWELVNAS